jgi:transcription initiation factor TFIID subunit 11
MSTFTPEQEHRHLMYKRSTLNKTQLKRIVNQTVSQSVTALPLIAIGAYSKFFVGEIVTRALDVQKEWATAFDVHTKKERERERERKRQRQQESEREQKRKGDEAAEKNTTEAKAADAKAGATTKDDTKVEETALVPNPHKGGLLPDHLREALRRYKADGEGGGVGFGSTSLGMMGNHGAGTWRVGGGVSARRLFR